ncbi:dolichyl-P-Glc:Glc(2)Man(9)GlcNAc(2)-PP-dolichol alpha-1,2- glucosyltransferase [Pneumocystis jirovecii RU7]|uniref:Dol-P-Glc:Glc(2)Man(9)GlcNAc(2)-PP-Dol alpha-1,2-glucosyltransferase n=1 Tax=Pneumocystis jirovecii (strain RU7) TaxID=1408657 RepID=A0A0W4ZW22_PNEJ7|nr:dolichyl-P-Glc:Glc(2)Man(9)GlcNAc(2)-PP-dolichol alpha-1,2- glucosyltransferase [Pneumocystis jirovecii RU7]KTW32563.1 hypothetical protein T551_00048 [Pneumocystis jirovecii RU7]
MIFLENLVIFIETIRYQHALIVQKHVPKPYMDEIFHLNQMQKYCKGEYFAWDDKITTPPGMYWIHLVILRATKWIIGECNLVSLRTLNVITATFLAVCFSGVIFYLRQDQTMKITEAILLTQFPLLYFYSTLYYTDILSTLLVFLSLYLTLRKQHKTSAMISFLSLAIRQTNVIWVLFLISLSIFPPQIFKPKIIDTEFTVWDPPARSACFFGKDKFIVKKSKFLRLFSFYQIFISAFDKAIYGYNKNDMAIYNCTDLSIDNMLLISEGDKTNHKIDIHLLQLFYFSIFTAFWGSPHLLTKNSILYFFKYSLGSRLAWLRTCGILIAIGLIVHFNTKEHPFLISDNRHYTFYIWRRTIKAHSAAKYIAVPFYYTSMWAILNKLILYQKVSYVLSFVVATTLVLGFVSLLEFRYFIIPYLLWRSSIQSTHKLKLYIEAFLFLCINYITMDIFLYKPFFWESDPGNLQRFMW